MISKIKEWNPNVSLVGFKLLVGADNDDIEIARQSVIKNKCDLVVVNNYDDLKKGQHKITLVKSNKNYTDIASIQCSSVNLANFVTINSLGIKSNDS